MTVQDLKDLDKFLREIRDENDIKSRKFKEALRLQQIVVSELTGIIKER